MKSLLVFLIVRVEFADGSLYSDEKMYQALKGLCENVKLYDDQK